MNRKIVKTSIGFHSKYDIKKYNVSVEQNRENLLQKAEQSIKSHKRKQHFIKLINQLDKTINKIEIYVQTNFEKSI
jgi:hypothetical protein